MPEQWFTEDYKDRRAKCNVPKDVTFRTKPQLAVEMLQAIRSKGRLPFKYISNNSSPSLIVTLTPTGCMMPWSKLGSVFQVYIKFLH